MPGQIAIESPTVARRQLLTTNVTSSTPMTSNRAGAKAEVSNGGSSHRARGVGEGSNDGSSHRGSRVGETAGECAALCCCCPCAMVHLVILAVYRLPTGLWRKKKRNRLLKKKRKSENSPAEEKKCQRKMSPLEEAEESNDGRGENDAVDWENEMWGRFHEGGFWRSASRRTHDRINEWENELNE